MEFVVGGGVVVNAGKLFDFAASERRIYHILILIFELSSFLGRSLQELVRRLNAGEIPHVRQAFLANAQSKVLLVEFDQEIAEKILDAAPKFGAAPHPVGSESKYEFAPMIYRVSGTFRAQDPTIEHRMIRINPMRSGPDTIIRILRSCMEQVEEN